MSTTQVPTQSQITQVNFSSCLVVTRHKLLEAQQKDVEKICQKVEIKPELPNDQAQLKQTIEPYDVIVGVLPLTLQVQVLQSKKVFMTFVMTSLGVFDSEEEAKAKASLYPGRAVILPPSKQGEKWRVTRYDGVKVIKEIKVIDEWVIQHPS